MGHKSFEFVSGTVKIDPTGKGARVEGEIVLRNKVTRAVAVSFIAADTAILLDGVDIGGAGGETTHDPPHEVAPDGTITVPIGGGVSSEDADTNAVTVLATVVIRLDGGEEQVLKFRALSSGSGKKETVGVKAAG